MSYAGALNPDLARSATPAPQAGDDLYPLIGLQIVSSDIAKVRDQDQIQLKVSSGEEVDLVFEVFIKSGKGMRRIGSRFVSPFLNGPGQRGVTVAVDGSVLNGKRKAKIFVWARARDGEGYPGLASATKKLS